MLRTLSIVSVVITSGMARAQSDLKAPTMLEAFEAGSGPALVMLGGGIRGAAEFAPHVPRLTRSFRVVRLQTLNIASAEGRFALPAGYSVKVESRALDASLDRLGIKAPADFVGHSFGALVALDFALDHPDRIRSLTVAEPPAFWVVPRSELQASGDMRNMYELSLELQPTVTPTDEQLIRFFCALGNCGMKPPAPTDSRWQEWNFRRSALRGLSAVSNHSDDIMRLRRFRRPVLIVTGTDTVSFHRRIDEILAAEFPASERLDLPGGHGAVASAWEEFVRGLLDFLRRRP